MNDLVVVDTLVNTVELSESLEKDVLTDNDVLIKYNKIKHGDENIYIQICAIKINKFHYVNLQRVINTSKYMIKSFMFNNKFDMLSPNILIDKTIGNPNETGDIPYEYYNSPEFLNDIVFDYLHRIKKILNNKK